jgi:hypothetical protein
MDTPARVASPEGPCVGELAQPALGDEETSTRLLEDAAALEDVDIDRPRTQGYGFASIQQLVIEHLLDAR